MSKFGYIQSIRGGSGGVQQMITLERLREFIIPEVSKTFKLLIDQIYLKTCDLRQQSTAAYSAASTLLLRALGLESWQAPEPLSYVRNSREAFAAGRLDAEHFQPKYEEISCRVGQNVTNLVALGEIIQPVRNGFDARDFIEGGTPYIRVGDIKGCSIDLESTAKVSLELSEINKDIRLIVGDILFTRKGSFGNAAPVFEEHTGAIISSEIMLLRIKRAWRDEILPEYLSLFFNSLFGKMQAERWAHGAAFYSVSQEDLQRFLVPVLELHKQKEISDLFFIYRQKNTEAARLLDAAKRAVEIAIERGEDKAMEMLREEVEEA
jgi:type I restriction enzyme M protein